MEILFYFLAIVVVYIIIDVYYRLSHYRRWIRFLNITNQITNKTLTQKGVLTRKDLEKSKKEVLDSLYVGDYSKLKKDLLKLGVDIDK